MHSSCILDSVVNLLIGHMVFAGNIHKSPVASHLKGLDPSLDFCCQGPALTGIKEGDKMSGRVKPLLSLYSCAGQFESYVVANPEDRFSHDVAHIVPYRDNLFT